MERKTARILKKVKFLKSESERVCEVESMSVRGRVWERE